MQPGTLAAQENQTACHGIERDPAGLRMKPILGHIGEAGVSDQHQDGNAYDIERKNCRNAGRYQQ